MLGLVVLGLAMAALVEAVRVAARWRAGRAVPVAWREGLAALPRRYLRDVHRVVARDPVAARMHAQVAGGLLAGSALLERGQRRGWVDQHYRRQQFHRPGVFQ